MTNNHILTNDFHHKTESSIFFSDNDLCRYTNKYIKVYNNFKLSDIHTKYNSYLLSMYKIIKNNYQINNNKLRLFIDALIDKKMSIKKVTNDTYPFQHISCLLCKQPKYYKRCNHRRKLC